MRSKTIAQYAREMDTNKVALYVNDRMNPDDDNKNRIMFEISLLNAHDKKLDSVVFFMEIIEAKYIANKILTGQFNNNEDYPLIRGKGGEVRAFTISKKPNLNSSGELYYSIKIDLGSGSIKKNGISFLEKKEKTMYYNLTDAQMEKLFIDIRDRILINDLLFAIAGHIGSLTL